MAFKDGLLSEFDVEMANTRRTLERVPDGKFDFKPHEKCGTLGWMASHVATIPHWATITLQQDSFDVAPAGGASHTPPKPGNRKELLEAFDKSVAEARAAINGASDEDFQKPWALLMGGKQLFSMPRAAVLRSMVFNHGNPSPRAVDNVSAVAGRAATSAVWALGG
jgi:hypothetical protein